MTKKISTLGWVGGLVLAVSMSAATVRGAALYTETFDSGSASWVDRDAAEMTVTHNAGIGNPAGSLQGTFALQGVPSPETDAFRANAGSSGGSFTGDYWTDVPGFNSWTFDFYADDVLPSDLIVRFGNGVNTFFRNVSTQLSSLDTWTTITVPLSYSGWFGGTATQFSNVLSGVTFVDVQVTRNGTGAQDYYLDNFQLNGTPVVVVPEPNYLLMLGVTAFLIRQQRIRHTARA